MNPIWFWSIAATVVLLIANAALNKAIDKANKKKKEQFNNGRNGNNSNGSNGENNSI